MRLLTGLGFLTVLLAVNMVVAEEPAAWSIEESRAPEQITLDFMATEGTWMSLDVSPDGRHIVFDLLGHIYEMPVAGGEATPLTSGRSWNMFPRYSPDGTRIVLTSDRGGSDDLWVMGRSSGELENISKMPDGVSGGMWSADGRFLYGVAMHDVTQNTVYQFGFHGTRQVLIGAASPTAARPGAGFRPVNHFRDDPTRGVIFFEHIESTLHAGGGAIKTYDKTTGEVKAYISRPGGAVAPTLSPDRRFLAYVHRRDQVSELVLHDLETRHERVLLPEIERDRQDYFVYHHAAYPTMAWMPDGRSLLLWFGGGIQRVSIDDGSVTRIPFEAHVTRKLDPTLRFKHEIPQGSTTTRIHRWAQRTPIGILFETLGDLYLNRDGTVTNITRSDSHETSPLYDSERRRLFFAAWSDDELGALYSSPLDGGPPRRLTSTPSQYGSLALSPDGERLAFVRGDNKIRSGTRLEMQTDFELVTMAAGGGDEVEVAEISWAGAEWGTRPPFVRYSADGESLFFTDFVGTVLVLKRIGVDGHDERELYRFPHSAYAALSPDEKWILYEEYQRTYLTPFDFAGKTIDVSAQDGAGKSTRIDEANDGIYPRWSSDGEAIAWTRGREFLEKSVDAVLADGEVETRVDLAVDFDVPTNGGDIALTNARILTMDPERRVLENATLLVRDGRIAVVGADIEIPGGAHVINLTGRTVMPGIVDVHGHYLGMMAPTHVIEQRVPTLRAVLAHGVTTLYEVYGVIPKDFWLSDMLRAGKSTGPRLYSTGPPMYGSRKFRPKTYLSFTTYDDALEHVRFNKAHGATALKDYLIPTRQIRHQIATAAREEGLNVIAEPGGDGQVVLTRVIDGATDVAHGMGFTSVYQDYIEFFSANQLGITPTLIVTLDGPMGELYFHQSERLWEDPKLNRFARFDELVARLRRTQHIFEDDFFHPELAANLMKLHDAGVPVLLGGHGQLLGLDAHFEMELYSHGGFSNMEVLAIATIASARHHGMDHDLGSLEAGKLADLIVLGENPLDDIRNSRSVELVMKNGILYSGDDAARVYPDPEPAGEFYFKR